MNNKIKNHIKDHSNLINKNVGAISICIDKIAKDIELTLKNNKTIFLAGNGGSAADCEHIAGELVGRYKKNRKPYKALSLTTDTSVITCIANDFGYDKIFYPDNFDCSMASIDSSIKNKISHRAIAVKDFMKKFNKLIF